MAEPESHIIKKDKRTPSIYVLVRRMLVARHDEWNTPRLLEGLDRAEASDALNTLKERAADGQNLGLTFGGVDWDTFIIEYKGLFFVNTNSRECLGGYTAPTDEDLPAIYEFLQIGPSDTEHPSLSDCESSFLMSLEGSYSWYQLGDGGILTSPAYRQWLAQARGQGPK